MEYDRKKDKGYRITALILIVIFFIIASQCSSQVLRLANYQNDARTTSIYPDHTIDFESPKSASDTIHLSVVADSINPNGYYVRLYAYYPENIVASPKIYIRYEGGNVDVFTQTVYNADGNYAEYSFTTESYKNIPYRKYEAIVFDKVAICTETKNKDYFINFFKNL